MTHLDRIDELSLAVADGRTAETTDPIADGSDDARIAARLIELSGLKALFGSRAAGAQAPEPVCPFRWGRLEVIEVIGQGSFARVYRARDPVLDRDVALKLFRHDRTDLDADQLIAEARRHARVHHPRVLAVHGAEVADGVAGLWTDLLEGQTLADRIGAEGTLQGQALRALARDLAAGLRAVHDCGIVHGDLKPANVWLDRSGRAILMDFGAAESRGATAPARYGSPVTMAPELFDGAAPTPEADSYALGAVLHFAATGRYPVTGATLAEIRQAHGDGHATDRRELLRAFPEEGRIVLGLLARRAGERLSLEHVLDMLDSIEAAPQRRLRRRAVAAVIASLVVGLAVSLTFLDRSEKAREVAVIARIAAEEAREQAERAQFEAQTSKDFLIESVRRFSPAAERGLGTVRAVLDFLDEFAEERLAETPLAQGELMVVVGTRLTHFGEVERGLALAEAGIKRIEEAASGASREKARAYYALGDAERQLGRYDVATRHGEQALAVLGQLAQTDEIRYEATQIRGMLVGIHGDLGNWAEELAAQREQLAERAALVGKDDPRMAVEYNNLGQSLRVNGRYDEALQVFRRAMALLEAGETPRPFPEALVNEAIAVTLLGSGYLDDAEAELIRTRERFEALGLEPGDERFGRLRRAEAQVLRKRGDLDAALMIFASLAEADAIPLQVRYNRIFYGVALLDGGRPAEALAQFEQARAAYAWRENHPEHEYLDGALAFAAAASAGDLSSARRAVADALRFFESRGYGDTDLARDLASWARRISESEVAR